MKNKSLLVILPIIISLSLVVILAFSASATTIYSAKKYSWGVSYNKDNTPQSPDGLGILEKNGGIYLGDTTKKEVYLTFDLGYEAGYTDEVLDILKKNNIKAIFFLCGHYLKETDLVNRMLNEGHIIGNHTNRHKDLPTISDADIEKDIQEFTDILKEKYPSCPAPTLFRPPQGTFCNRSLSIVKSKNLKTVMWSIAIKDWEKTPIDPTKSSDRIISRLHPGAIVLLHIANSGMPNTVEQLITKLNSNGYSIGTLA